MAYYINDERVSLSTLGKRILETDLIPSREILKEDVVLKMEALQRQGIGTLAQLRKELKNSKRLTALAEAAAINSQYLDLLRREIESYFPKPFALKEYDWLPPEWIQKLAKQGIHTTADLYRPGAREVVFKTLDDPASEDLISLADLARVQWVSPTTARMLVLAGISSAARLAAMQGEDLYQAFQRVNAEGGFFKGTIGLRDCRRLIRAAGYLVDPDWL
jgi:hypothetical protein